MRMSSGSRWGSRSVMVPSTAAAGTINHIARGLSSFVTKSWSEELPSAFSCISSFTTLWDLSKTTHRWPPLTARRTMFAPILPRPIIPNCMEHSFANLSFDSLTLLRTVKPGPSIGHGLFECCALGSDDLHEFIPGLDERLCALILKLGSQRIHVDAGISKLR